jgi:hypothetical protein
VLLSRARVIFELCLKLGYDAGFITTQAPRTVTTDNSTTIFEACYPLLIRLCYARLPPRPTSVNINTIYNRLQRQGRQRPRAVSGGGATSGGNAGNAEPESESEFGELASTMSRKRSAEDFLASCSSHGTELGASEISEFVLCACGCGREVHSTENRHTCAMCGAMMFSLCVMNSTGEEGFNSKGLCRRAPCASASSSSVRLGGNR